MNASLSLRRSEWAQGLMLWVLLFACALTWWPGTTGPFLFDDFSNLDGLRLLSREPSLYATLQYALSGISSELGRPLALASFALQHASWDRNPEDFLRVNVLLHLLNGALWFWLLVRLQRLGALPAARWLPFAACALWLLLPIHGAAVLYVVQRMTLLAATFSLGGLLLYVAGRRSTESGHGYALMSCGVIAGLGLGTLAKETAALLPAIILALEATLLRHVPRPARWNRWSAVFLWIPCALLVAYLALLLPGLSAQYALREFTLAERLLTEARILLSYLWRAVVPSPGGFRLLHDDIPVSTSLVQPWTTLASLVVWAALVGAAVGLRRQAPLFTLAVAWYLIGHSLESTFIPLELAFDHRSYFPSLGPVLALCAGLAHLLGLARPRAVPVLAAAGIAYLACLVVGLWMSASLWGRPLEQAAFWAHQQPESHRVLYQFADALQKEGRHGQALALYRAGAARWPDDPVAALSMLRLRCIDPGITTDPADIRRRLHADDGRDRFRALGLLEQIVDRVQRGECPYLDAGAIVSALDAALTAPKYQPLQANLYYTAALLQYALGDRERALLHIEQAFARHPQVPLLQYAVAWSLELGDVGRARGYLHIAESDQRIPPQTRWIYRAEIGGTRQLIDLYESLAEPPAKPET